ITSDFSSFGYSRFAFPAALAAQFKKLTPSEYETQYGIPIVEIAPQGVVSLRSIIDSSKNIEISCNNTYGPYPRITITCKEIIITYTYEDAVQIRDGICGILNKQVRQ
ncbi:hypothetical protein, partial [uncultured Victivallis sp.]|uniref:hypothetical protein n=1 Tax=uncultured Victivallis sp. TaxID=354118 RepID=UPI0025DF15D6